MHTTLLSAITLASMVSSHGFMYSPVGIMKPTQIGVTRGIDKFPVRERGRLLWIPIAMPNETTICRGEPESSNRFELVLVDGQPSAVTIAIGNGHQHPGLCELEVMERDYSNRVLIARQPDCMAPENLPYEMEGLMSPHWYCPGEQPLGTDRDEMCLFEWKFTPSNMKNVTCRDCVLRWKWNAVLRGYNGVEEYYESCIDITLLNVPAKKNATNNSTSNTATSTSSAVVPTYSSSATATSTSSKETSGPTMETSNPATEASSPIKETPYPSKEEKEDAEDTKEPSDDQEEEEDEYLDCEEFEEDDQDSVTREDENQVPAAREEKEKGDKDSSENQDEEKEDSPETTTPRRSSQPTTNNNNKESCQGASLGDMFCLSQSEFITCTPPINPVRACSTGTICLQNGPSITCSFSKLKKRSDQAIN